MPPKTPPVLTRYLYLKSAVKISIKQSILQGILLPALFWTYELFDSGFEKETCEIIVSIYDENIVKLQVLSSILKNSIDKLREKDTCINRDFLGLLVKSFTENIGTDGTIKNTVVQLVDPEILKELETIDVPESGAYKYLQNQCKFAVLPDTALKTSEILDIYRNNWLFHASYSPLWEKRIKEFGGKIERRKKTVLFSEDHEERFYDRYGLEPDEQPLEIQHRCLGVNNCV